MNNKSNLRFYARSKLEKTSLATLKFHDYDQSEAKDKFEKIYGTLKDKLDKVRIGVANKSKDERLIDFPLDLIEHIKVGQNRLVSLGKILVRDGRCLLIKFNEDSIKVKEVEKAVRDAIPNCNPQMESRNMMLITIPEVTQEMRMAVSKGLSSMKEEAKIHLRSLRTREVNNAREKFIPDAMRMIEDFMQREVEFVLKKMDKLVEEKKKEIES